MKTIELTKQQTRHLVMSLEASGKGFNIGQLRKLNTILDNLTQPIAEFSAEIDRISQTIKDGLERDELLERLTNTDGKDPVALKFEEAEYDLLKVQWSGLQFTSSRFARSIVLGIDDAMQAAEVRGLAQPGKGD